MTMDKDPLEDVILSRQKPGDPDYHNNRGNILMGKDDFDGALAEYEEALRLRPGDVTFRCNRAIVLGRMGRVEDALREYEECVRADPRDWHSHFNMANLLLRAGRVKESAARYREALAVDSSRPETHYHLAAALQRLHDWDGAVERFEEGLKGDPAHPLAPQAHVAVGARDLAAGRSNDAEGHFLAALEADPESFMACYGLGELYLVMPAGPEGAGALKSKALDYARRAAELRPDDPDAQDLASRALAAWKESRS